MRREVPNEIDAQCHGTLEITAIIPAYNSADHLSRAIASVLAQESPVTEIIVVDDGSTDGTFELATGYGPPVPVVRQENAGAAAARNRGIAEAKGDLIAFLDSDDEWTPRHLANAMTSFRSHPDLQWYCDACEVVGYDGKTSVRRVHAPSEGGDGTFLPDSLLAEAKSIFLSTNGVVVRREALDDVGVFDTSWPTGEDRDLWYRLGLVYGAIGYCCEPGSRYNLRDGSLTTRQDLLQADRFVDLSLRQLALADEMGHREAARAAVLIGRWVEHVMWLLYRSDQKTDATYVRKRLKHVISARWRFVGWLYQWTPQGLWSLGKRIKLMLR